MLEPLKHFLSNKSIILASVSPRRKEILEKNLGLNVKIVPSLFPENLDKSIYTPYEYVLETSRCKVLDVANNLKNEDWFLIIGADTVIQLENTVYEKPSSKENAFEMLKKFSNKKHEVITGVTLVKKTPSSELNIRSFYETSEVYMANLTDDVIKAYVETGEPMDKAGGYGIQGLGSSLIQSIKGDYFNIMGFPTYRFAIEFSAFLKNE